MQVDGCAVENLPLEEVEAMILGRAGTKVSRTIVALVPGKQFVGNRVTRPVGKDLPEANTAMRFSLRRGAHRIQRPPYPLRNAFGSHDSSRDGPLPCQICHNIRVWRCVTWRDYVLMVALTATSSWLLKVTLGIARADGQGKWNGYLVRLRRGLVWSHRAGLERT